MPFISLYRALSGGPHDKHDCKLRLLGSLLVRKTTNYTCTGFSTSCRLPKHNLFKTSAKAMCVLKGIEEVIHANRRSRCKAEDNDADRGETLPSHLAQNVQFEKANSSLPLIKQHGPLHGASDSCKNKKCQASYIEFTKQAREAHRLDTRRQSNES